MINCPRCNAATYSNGTQGGGIIVRHRVCRNPACGHRFKTTQTPEEVILEKTFERIPNSEPQP